MAHNVVFFEAALVEVAFLAAVEDTLVIVPPIVLLVDLEVLLQV